MTAFFVTATGTDIGKTFIAAGLIRHLRARGQTVSAIKPVVSGYDPARAGESDPGILLAAMDRPVTTDEIARISPWRYSAPLSPDMAAAREGGAIDFAELLKFSRDAIARAAGTLFVEGIGGIMVPLDERNTVLDWMAELSIPLIVITGTYLGALSHTLTALDVLRRRDLRLAALVINESEGAGVPLIDTMNTLSRFAPGVPIATFPRLTERGGPVRARAAFHELAWLCGIDRR